MITMINLVTILLITIFYKVSEYLFFDNKYIIVK